MSLCLARCPLHAWNLIRDMNKHEFHFPSTLETDGLLHHSSRNEDNGMPSSFTPNIAKYMMAEQEVGGRRANQNVYKNH